MSMVVAQVDILSSNSMIERFWLSMKHNWLYTQRLDSLVVLRRLVDFYVDEHNNVIPHSAFNGQTPSEVFHGEGAGLREQLALRRREARDKRMAVNRRARCGACDDVDGPSHEAVP